jgi:hypothetical protein
MAAALPLSDLATTATAPAEAARTISAAPAAPDERQVNPFRPSSTRFQVCTSGTREGFGALRALSLSFSCFWATL